VKFTKYLPLFKVDEKARTISGIACSDTPDRDGEVADYTASKAAFKKWSGEALRATLASGAEASYGNVRLSHSLQIAGKLSAAPIFDDEAKEISIVTQPVDEKTFQLAARGLLTSFSIGGDYAFRECAKCIITQKCARSIRELDLPQ
jgi:hypothetical protein